MGRLTNIAIKNAAPGKMHDGDGLMLVRTEDAGRWVFRYSHLGKRRDMGLGSWPDVSLADARRMRGIMAAELAAGLDPIATREARRAAERAERDRMDPSLADAIDVVFEARKGRLRGEGVRGRWRSPLEVHIIPRLGRRRLSSVTPDDLASAVRPIWKTKHPTAEKVMQRLRIVFRDAQLMGWPVEPLTVDRAIYMLGEHIHQVQHIPATDWREAPALFAKLREGTTATDRCLMLMMLTLVRTDGCTGARPSEEADGVWTVPADRIKGREGRVKDFRVPLPDLAARLFQDAREAELPFVAPGRRGKPLTSTALEKRMTHHGETGRPHALRSTFRSWVQDTDACPREVAEMVLGHKVYADVEGSYARSDLLERRRPVMDAWARFLSGETAAQIVPLRR